jgi:hypothetical protein
MAEAQEKKGPQGDGFAQLVFRESALEKLALQDELDQLFLPTPRYRWFFRLAVILGIGASLVYWVAQ